MPIELRPIEPEEFLPFARAASMGFGAHVDEEQIDSQRSTFEFDRSIAAIEDGRFVGSGGIFSFDLTLPGCTTVPAAGVTWISVIPTHRRRGILTSIMRRQFEDMRARNEPLGMLYASESIIYGRYGYGCATMHAGYEIDPKHGAFDRAPEIRGRPRLLDKEEATGVLPAVYERFRPQQPGALSRSPGWWDLWFKDRKDWRDGASARFYVVYESLAGEVNGYLSYRVKEKWEHGFPASTLQIWQVIALDPEARAALWKYCLTVDLMAKIESFNSPNDEPVRWMLADPRRLRLTSLWDSLWVRLVDIPASLGARRYATADRIVFQVTDRFLPDNDGCYELDGSPDGAACRRSNAPPDLALEVTDLGAGYLGGMRFTTLARSGRIIEHTSGAALRADAMFASAVNPWCTTGF